MRRTIRTIRLAAAPAETWCYVNACLASGRRDGRCIEANKRAAKVSTP